MLRGSLLRLASSPRGGGLRALCSSSRPSATDLLSATRPGQSVVWIAPCARTFKAEASSSKGSTFVFRDEVDPDYFSAPDAPERATTVVVSAQSVTKDFMQAWRASLPDDEKLTLVRRGTSLGSIDVNAAKKLGIRVANTPGVNSPHVAKFVVDTLGLSIVDALDVALARAVVIGSGSVGQSVIALLNTVGITPTVVNRSPESPKLEDALKGATHVAVCAATSGSQPILTSRHMDALFTPADCQQPVPVEIVSVSRPEAFSLNAILKVAARRKPPATLRFDYGEPILAPVREQVNQGGLKETITWSSEAMASEACKEDLDAAVLSLLIEG